MMNMGPVQTGSTAATSDPLTEDRIMKTQRFPLIVMVVMGVALTACGPREKPLPNNVITALQSRYNENDPAGASELFTEDGAVMTEFGETVRGKQAIKDFFATELDKRLQYWVTSEGSSSVGSFGYDQGGLRIRDTVKGQDLENAKYMTLFRKVDGSWKIYRTIYNTNSLDVCTSVRVTPVNEAEENKAP